MKKIDRWIKGFLILGLGFLALAVSPTSAAPATGIEIVTTAEYEASLRAPEPLASKSLSDPGGPIIVVDSPQLGGRIASPTPIRVRFVASEASTVNPETFKVRYGALRIDITERLLKEVKISREGFSFPNAALPAGTHTLAMSIQDDKNRRTEQLVRFEVLK